MDVEACHAPLGDPNGGMVETAAAAALGGRGGGGDGRRGGEGVAMAPSDGAAGDRLCRRRGDGEERGPTGAPAAPPREAGGLARAAGARLARRDRGD